MSAPLSNSAVTDSEALLQFATRYCNWQKFQTLALSFDIDFVPDYMLEYLLAALEPFDYKATFFVTHPSKLLAAIAQDSRYELAIHPYRSPESTQGGSFEEIVDSLQQCCPAAEGNRFHRLEFSYRDRKVLRGKGIRYDSSTLHFNCPYLLPIWHRDIDMVLLPYCWEDGTCEDAGYPMRIESIDLQSPGMKILAFHPLNIFLNINHQEQRMNFHREHQLSNCPQAVAEQHRQDGAGAGSLFAELLQTLQEREIVTVTLHELASAYRAQVVCKGQEQ